MARGFPVSFSLSSTVLGVALMTLLASACSRPIGPSACTDPRDCAAGESCVAGICSVGVGGSCTTDLDCDPASGQLCSGGTCVAGGVLQPDNDGGACTATADCPISQFCNTATGFCSALLEGWCRQDNQCAEDAPLCSNVSQGSDYPGRCVQCVTDVDCGGAACVSPGVCTADVGCGDNASAIANGCRCNPGFVGDPTTGCTPDLASEGEGEGDTGTEGEGDTGTEGEGEGGDGEACTEDSECFARHDINWMCGAQGSCVCDENWLDFDCNGDYDLDACACGGGSSTPGTLNQPCDFNFDCGTDEACFIGYGATASDPGACKTTCATAADCTAGQDCMIGGWVGDLGFCADIRFPGDACDAAVFSVDIGFDAMCDGSDDAVIFDCFSGRCEQVCDWAGNTGAEQSCNAGSCGNLAFHAEAGGDVAVCE